MCSRLCSVVQSPTGRVCVQSASSGVSEDEAVAGMEDLHLTAQGGQQLTLTPKQLRTLTKQQLVRIWKGYINQLAELLVGLEKGDQNAGTTIKKYVGELVRVRGGREG